MSTVVIGHQGYNLKKVDIILQEMTRTGYCSHVDFPQKPKFLYGSVDKAKKLIAREKSTATRTVYSHGKEYVSNKIQPSERVFMGGIASINRQFATENPDLFQIWQDETCKFLKDEYGDQLAYISIHFDEENPHIHFGVVPRNLDLANICGGALAEKMERRVAAEQGKPRPSKKRIKTIYTAQMVAYVDKYYAKVGVRSGLARIGPNNEKVKITKKQWRTERLKNKEFARQLEAEKKKSEDLTAQLLKSEKNNLLKDQEIAKQKQIIFNIAPGIFDDENNQRVSIKKEVAAARSPDKDGKNSFFKLLQLPPINTIAIYSKKLVDYFRQTTASQAQISFK